MAHWLLWTGISFIIAGFVSMAITFGGEAPQRLIEEFFGYSVAWIILGVVLAIFGFVKKKRKQN